MDWKENIITTDVEIKQLLETTKTIAVLGIKPESRSGQPAFYVPKYMQNAGHKIKSGLQDLFGDGPLRRMVVEQDDTFSQHHGPR